MAVLAAVAGGTWWLTGIDKTPGGESKRNHHLTRALRRPQRSEPGGPGPRSGRDVRREIGRRGRPLGAGLRRPAGIGRAAVRGLLRRETHCYTAYSGVRVNTRKGMYFGSCASTRS